MSRERIAYWNARHFRRAGRKPAPSPALLLRASAGLLPGQGLALDVAAGLGQNSLFLARRGLHVLALDFAETGLRHLVQCARAEGLPVQAAVCDARCLAFGLQRYDVIVNTMFLERRLFPFYQEALRPGGLLFFESLVAAAPDAGRHYLQPDELKDCFPKLEILHEATREVGGEAKKGSWAAQLIARKPGSIPG